MQAIVISILRKLLILSSIKNLLISSISLTSLMLKFGAVSSKSIPPFFILGPDTSRLGYRMLKKFFRIHARRNYKIGCNYLNQEAILFHNTRNRKYKGLFPVIWRRLAKIWQRKRIKMSFCLHRQNRLKLKLVTYKRILRAVKIS